MYGKKSPSVGTASVYSHVTTKSSTNLRSSRSIKSLRTPWYRKPIVHDAIIMNIQKASMMTGAYSIFLAIFTAFTACFDLYCLSMATPGTTHYGYYLISYEFVYVGNRHVRNALIMFAVFSLLLSVAVFVATIVLIIALRKEYERRMIPWLVAFGAFAAFRLFAFLFFSIVNDLIFAYNVLMCVFWAFFSIVNVYGWIIVYSLYVELADLTKLEDLANLRMGTMASLNASGNPSLAGSRPVTPHSSILTTPVV